jgi:hypothetical protein
MLLGILLAGPTKAAQYETFLHHSIPERPVEGRNAYGFVFTIIDNVKQAIHDCTVNVFPQVTGGGVPRKPSKMEYTCAKNSFYGSLLGPSSSVSSLLFTPAQVSTANNSLVGLLQIDQSTGTLQYCNFAGLLSNPPYCMLINYSSP